MKQPLCSVVKRQLIEGFSDCSRRVRFGDKEEKVKFERWDEIGEVFPKNPGLVIAVLKRTTPKPGEAPSLEEVRAELK